MGRKGPKQMIMESQK